MLNNKLMAAMMLALNGVAALTIQNRENVEEEQVD